MQVHDIQTMKIIIQAKYGTYLDNLLLQVTYGDETMEEKMFDADSLVLNFGRNLTAMDSNDAYRMAVYLSLGFGALNCTPVRVNHMDKKVRFTATATTAI